MNDTLAANPPSGRAPVPADERAAAVPAGPPAAEFTFTVPGQPVGWARAGGGKTMHRFTPAAQRNYSVAVKLFCQATMEGAPPLDGAIAIEIHAVYPWPASWSRMKRINPVNRWKSSRPDYDNIAKLVGDALNTIAWTDDARICLASISKYYGDLPCLTVRVKKL